MLHGDDAPTSIEVVKLARRQARRPSQQKAARPRRRRPTKYFGYARVAGSQIHLHEAVQAILGAGVLAADIYTDYGPVAHTRRREGLQQALQQAESGDTLVVSSLVTFARSQGELARWLTILDRRQIALQIGERRLTDIAPPERSAMSAAITDRLLIDIQEARAAARAAQDPRGSRRALTPEQEVEVIEAFDARQPRREITSRFGISLATLFRTASE